jgi:hypothetical protein
VPSTVPLRCWGVVGKLQMRATACGYAGRQPTGGLQMLDQHGSGLALLVGGLEALSAAELPRAAQGLQLLALRPAVRVPSNLSRRLAALPMAPPL